MIEYQLDSIPVIKTKDENDEDEENERGCKKSIHNVKEYLSALAVKLKLKHKDSLNDSFIEDLSELNKLELNKKID